MYDNNFKSIYVVVKLFNNEKYMGKYKFLRNLMK